MTREVTTKMTTKTKKKISFKSLFLDKKNIVTFVLTLVLIAGFVGFGIKVVNQRADISRMEIQKQEIALKVEKQEQENKELQAVLDNENKDDYIEQKAREKGYVKSDEIVFYDISASE